jgi:hypothetical protein
MPRSPRSRVVACTDCSNVTRRDFLKTTAAGVAGVTAAASGIITVGTTPRVSGAAEAAKAAGPASETLAAQFFKSLNDEQKKAICFPFDHPLRSKVDNNWFIVDKTIKDLLKPEQQQLVHDIFMSMHSEEYAPKVLKQVEDDNKEDGGFKSCAVACFGEPGDGGKGKFEFVFTGRHVTRRCDGNSVEGEAFGGPIFYGHAAEGFNESPQHRGNVYWYQARRANEVFQALDGKQRAHALSADPRPERQTETVKLSGRKDGLSGIPLSELSKDQKGLVRKVMDDLLAPFRKTDADKALALIEAGGMDNLHMTFYNGKYDIGNDGVWDVWQLEGPSMLWYFRGAPHVHTWVHIREPEKA